MTDLERLLAIEEIKKLKARYFRFADTKQKQPFRDLFTSDATVLYHDVDSEFRPLTDVLDKLEAVMDQCTSIHKGYMPEIDILSPTEARGIWAMEDYLFWHADHPDGITQMIGRGHYHETYVFQDGAWKIRTLELTRLRVEVQSLPKTFRVEP